MLKSVLLSTAALALIATSADAHPQVTLSHDNRFTTVLPHSGQSVPATPGGGKYMYSTIDPSKVGSYFCCYGSTLSGPSSTLFQGKAYGVAEQFVATSAGSIKELAAGVGYVSGDHTVTLTLYADSGSNSPGKEITHGTGTSTTEFGFCCGITTAKIKKTTLSANTPYWIGITTTGTNYEAAPFQVFNEVNDYVYLSYTSNGGSTWSSGVSETEYDPAIGVK